MYINESRTPRGIGILPLQHADHFAQQYAVDMRVNLIATRVLGRRTAAGQIGEYVYDPETVGDIIGGMHWPRHTREISAWSFGFPTVTGGKHGLHAITLDTTPPPTPTGEDACPLLNDLHMLPVNDDDTLIGSGDPWAPQKTFSSIQLTRPKRNGKEMWPKFPKEFFGIGMIGTATASQVNYFLPVDPRMVAVQRHADPEIGSLVCDLSGDQSIDLDRMARLQSFWKVAKKPSGTCVSFYDGNSLAWSIRGSHCKDTRGGLVWDELASTGISSGITGIYGMASQHQSGPLDVGALNDQHFLGTDADGNPINALHLDINTYFRSSFQDGPLYVQNWELGGWWDRPTEVRFGFDPGQTHPFVCGPRFGAWKWYTSVPFSVPTFNGRLLPQPPPLSEMFRQGPPPTEDYPALFPVRAWQPGDPFEAYLATDAEIAHPGILARPQTMESHMPDIRKCPRGVPRKALEWLEFVIPITGRLEAYGAQGGVISGGSGGSWGWSYTQAPGSARYKSGTASGGWVMLPPEVDLADYSTDFNPSTVATRSSTHFVAGPATYFAAGLPNIATGGVKTAHRWSDDSTGNLLFEQLNSSGTAANALKLTSDNLVQIPVGASSFANAIGTIGRNFTSTGTTAVVTKETLATVTIPANALNANGKGIRVKAFGTTAANANAKTIRLEFGTDIVMVNDITTSPNNLDWEIDGVVFRTSSANQIAAMDMVVGAVPQSKDYTEPRQTDTAAIDVKLTGQNGVASANDIVCKGLWVEMVT